MKNTSSRKFIIAPSILSADFSELGQQIRTAEAAGADWIHIDIMDGHFVPNMSMGRLAVEASRKITQLPLDIHLMVQKPEKVLEIFAKAGANHITVHVEATQHVHRTLQKIRQLGCKAGIVLNPGTPTSMITPVLHLVDLVLVMTVNPGFGGQKFLPETLLKITEIRNQLDKMNLDIPIEVDGGISTSTLMQVINAGAQIFVAGNAIFNHPAGIGKGIQSLVELFPN
jgi:ribulose-phosphate 3-epimerase